MTLEELAARVEALEGPDREVDAEIAATQGLRVKPEGHPLGRCCYSADGSSVMLPRYTASLDVAMTLATPGYHTALVMEDRHTRRWQWELRGEFGMKARAHAITAPLALTAAALRARALSRTTEGEGE